MRNLDVFDQWWLCHILHIPRWACTSNEEVHWCTDQLLLTHTIRTSCWSQCTCRSVHEPQSGAQSHLGPASTRLESAVWLTVSHLTPDDQVQHYAAQRWSGNCLSSGTEPMCMQRPRRYGNICQRTLSNTMSMYRDNEYLSKNTNNIVQILYLRLY